MRARVLEDWRKACTGPRPWPDSLTKVVLVGHRAAGKTSLLAPLALASGRTGLDLDAEIERRTQQPLRALYETDPSRFRLEERAAFQALPAGVLVAAGGGFLSHHADLLVDGIAVLVPISLETYTERLIAETSRPRLRPELPLAEEIRRVYLEREAVHARIPVWSLGELLASLEARP